MLKFVVLNIIVVFLHRQINKKTVKIMAKNEIPLPDWVKVTLKVIVYICGLLLAGVGTTAAAQMAGII